MGVCGGLPPKINKTPCYKNQGKIRKSLFIIKFQVFFQFNIYHTKIEYCMYLKKQTNKQTKTKTKKKLQQE